MDFHQYNPDQKHQKFQGNSHLDETNKFQVPILDP